MEPVSTGRASMSMKTIFIQCQEKKQSHTRLLEYLKKLYHATSFSSFVEELENYILIVLQHPEPNSHVQNVLEFVSKFVSSLHIPIENKENELNCTTNTESDEPTSNPLLTKLLDFLVQFHNVENSAVRLHACRLLKLLLNDMNTDAYIDDELFEKLTEAMLCCLKDKVANIRIEATKALFRLQDPSNKECPVIKQYMFHMKADPNPLVREAILGCIGPTVVTLDPVVDRTRDVKEKVRKKAYEFLSDKVHIRALSISKRVRLLKEGLQDRSDIVKRTVSSHMVPAWLKMCTDSIVNFLRCLDVGLQETEESLEVTKLALNAILENQTTEKALNDFISVLNDEKVIPFENLTCENSFYWKYLIQHLQKHDTDTGENLLEQIQPELIKFCNYIKSYILTADSKWDLNKKLDHQFICEQLLEIASEYDLADIAGSQCLNAIVNDILTTANCGSALVKPLIACIIKTKIDPEERLVMVAEIISNIREPILTMEFGVSEEERKQTKLKIAKLRVQLNELHESIKIFADCEEFSKAQETKQQIKQFELEKEKLEKELLPSIKEVRTEKNDSDTLLKCITIVTELMTQAPFKKLLPTLSDLMDSLLVPGLHSPDPAVRKQGVLAVGLCSLLSLSIANTYFVLFLQISQMDQPSIQQVALRAIFDLLHMHGLEMFQATQSADVLDSTDDELSRSTDLYIPETPPHGEGKRKTVTNIVTILKSHLDSKYDEIRAISAQGLGKLLLLGHIYSSELLSHLILLWFNPTTDSNSLLLHFLGVFIPTYAAHGRNGKQCFEEAFIPSMITVLEAPHTSPLSRINTIHMAKVLLQLIQPLNVEDDAITRSQNELDVQESKPHDRIAEKVCLQILKEPDNYPSNQKWSQVLSTLYLSSSCLPVHKNINTLVIKINKRIRDKMTLKQIATFTKILDAILELEISQRNEINTMQDSVETCSTPTKDSQNIESEKRDVSVASKQSNSSASLGKSRNMSQMPTNFSHDSNSSEHSLLRRSQRKAAEKQLHVTSPTSSPLVSPSDSGESSSPLKLGTNEKVHQNQRESTNAKKKAKSPNQISPNSSISLRKRGHDNIETPKTDAHSLRSSRNRSQNSNANSEGEISTPPSEKITRLTQKKKETQQKPLREPRMLRQSNNVISSATQKFGQAKKRSLDGNESSTRSSHSSRTIFSSDTDSPLSTSTPTVKRSNRILQRAKGKGPGLAIKRKNVAGKEAPMPRNQSLMSDSDSTPIRVKSSRLAEKSKRKDKDSNNDTNRKEFQSRKATKDKETPSSIRSTRSNISLVSDTDSQESDLSPRHGKSRRLLIMQKNKSQVLTDNRETPFKPKEDKRNTPVSTRSSRRWENISDTDSQGKSTSSSHSQTRKPQHRREGKTPERTNQKLDAKETPSPTLSRRNKRLLSDTDSQESTYSPMRERSNRLLVERRVSNRSINQPREDNVKTPLNHSTRRSSRIISDTFSQDIILSPPREKSSRLAKKALGKSVDPAISPKSINQLFVEKSSRSSPRNKGSMSPDTDSQNSTISSKRAMSNRKVRISELTDIESAKSTVTRSGNRLREEKGTPSPRSTVRNTSSLADTDSFTLTPIRQTRLSLNSKRKAEDSVLLSTPKHRTSLSRMADGKFMKVSNNPRPSRSHSQSYQFQKAHEGNKKSQTGEGTPSSSSRSSPIKSSQGSPRKMRSHQK